MRNQMPCSGGVNGVNDNDGDDGLEGQSKGAIYVTVRDAEHA